VAIWNQGKVIDYRTFKTSYGSYLTSTFIIDILKITFVLSFQGTKSDLFFQGVVRILHWKSCCYSTWFSICNSAQCIRNTFSLKVPVNWRHVLRESLCYIQQVQTSTEAGLCISKKQLTTLTLHDLKLW